MQSHSIEDRLQKHEHEPDVHGSNKPKSLITRLKINGDFIHRDTRKNRRYNSPIHPNNIYKAVTKMADGPTATERIKKNLLNLQMPNDETHHQHHLEHHFHHNEVHQQDSSPTLFTVNRLPAAFYTPLFNNLQHHQQNKCSA
jgi:hypothetical protein